jgi:hypothetical protein
MLRGLSCALVFGLGLSASTSASAAGNDFRLNSKLANGDGIFFSQAGNVFSSNPAAWNSFVGELSYVFAPRFVTPAETLGYAGFHVGLMYSATFVSSDAPYWFSTENAASTGAPDGALQTLQLDVRKGLPGSLEIGLNLLWLANSSMFAPGLMLDWAMLEGYTYAPDVSVRAGVNTVVGMRDMDLTVAAFDIAVSKGFGLGGMFHLAPYLAYSMMLSGAASRVIDPTPEVENDADRSIVMDKIGFGDMLQHRLTIGTRMLVYILSITLQGEFEFLRDDPDGRKLFGGVATVSAKLGLDF